VPGENTGFRGSVVNVSEVIVQGDSVNGARVIFRVLFTDTEGVVHATTKHEIDPMAHGSDLQEAVSALVKAVTRWAETAHFSAPILESTKKEMILGLAESLEDATGPAGGSIPQG